MGGSIQLKYCLEVLFVLLFVPMILQSCINNFYQGILKQRSPIGYAPIWWVWTIGILIYWFAFAPYKFFKDLNIPYIKPEPVLGNLREFLKLGSNEFKLKYMKQLGPVFGMFLGRLPVLVVGHPELIKQVTVRDFKKFPNRPSHIQTKHPMQFSLLTARDEIWKKIRKTASPTFVAAKIKKTVPLIEECMNNLLPVFEKAAKAGESLEVFTSYGKFTVESILSVAFGTKAEVQSKEEKIAFEKKLDEFFNIATFTKYMGILDPPMWIRSIAHHLMSATDPKYFVDLLRPVINERKKMGKGAGKDFLDLMLAETPDGSAKLNDDEIIATSITFLLAGYETTANTLAYTTYLLALNPVVQDKLYQEVKEKFSDDENLSIYDRLQDLEYLDQVLSESLRLYPPAYQTVREAAEDCVIGENYIGGSKGIKIPKGTTVNIPIWAIHHNPKFWENPEEFNPDRFSPDNRASINPLNNIPFGYGPRNCIGMRFALLEAKFALATIVQKFKFERSPDTQVPLKFRLGVTMSPVHGIYLRVISRQ